MAKINKADSLLNTVYNTLKISTASDLKKYNKVNDIVQELNKIHKSSPISGKTTGTISERLCELGIKSIFKTKYNTLPLKWQWLGDFLVLGMPTNIVFSVKSFTAKERLLASGSGSLLYPTIAWGLFNDDKEWSKDRVIAYLYRGFYSIYIPDTFYNTLSSIHPDSLAILNLNGNKLIRKHSEFTNDLSTLKGSFTDTKLGEFVDIKKI